MQQVHTLQRREHQQCAVCHDALGPPDVELTCCPLCDTVLHPECAAAVARCPTLGCPIELAPAEERPGSAASFAAQMEARDGALIRTAALVGALVGLVAGAGLATPSPEVGPFWGIVGPAVVGAMQGSLLGPIAGLFLRAATTGTPELGAAPDALTAEDR